ncbi:hypothetical protein AVEN_76675-1 [Araneus ventricosus]|uniref:Uncharacterized protein n=1 Tax=Araneus ventricosus TaxID=182803 RepID=A0A4Y2BNY6_ARAVE|nr:hypothetical protein AVEN_76675-1 [Araneus ventricosus]
MKKSRKYKCKKKKNEWLPKRQLKITVVALSFGGCQIGVHLLHLRSQWTIIRAVETIRDQPGKTPVCYGLKAAVYLNEKPMKLKVPSYGGDEEWVLKVLD